MKMDAAVYAEDTLLMRELLDGIDGQLPEFNVNIYSYGSAVERIQSENTDLHVNSMSKFGNEDVLIVLSSDNIAYEHADNFDGSIIDITGNISSEDVIQILNPVEYLLYSVTENIQSLKGVCSLPVCVLGKKGVDDIVSQTKGLLSFTKAENQVLDSELAFNIILNENRVLNRYLMNLNEQIRKNFTFRLLPVTTGLILDIFGDTSSVAEDDLYKRENSLSEIVNNEGLSFKKYENGMVCVYADYLYVYVKQIIDELKKL